MFALHLLSFYLSCSSFPLSSSVIGEMTAHISSLTPPYTPPPCLNLSPWLSSLLKLLLNNSQSNIFVPSEPLKFFLYSKDQEQMSLGMIQPIITYFTAIECLKQISVWVIWNLVHIQFSFYPLLHCMFLCHFIILDLQIKKFEHKTK